MCFAIYYSVKNLLVINCIRWTNNKVLLWKNQWGANLDISDPNPHPNPDLNPDTSNPNPDKSESISIFLNPNPDSPFWGLNLNPNLAKKSLEPGFESESGFGFAHCWKEHMKKYSWWHMSCLEKFLSSIVLGELASETQCSTYGNVLFHAFQRLANFVSPLPIQSYVPVLWPFCLAAPIESNYILSWTTCGLFYFLFIKEIWQKFHIENSEKSIHNNSYFIDHKRECARNTIALVIFFQQKLQCHTVRDKSISFQNHNFLAVFINPYTTNPTWHGLACSASKFCRALAEHPLAACLADIARWMLGERSSGVVNIYGLRHFSKAIDQEREYAYGNTIRPLP